MNEERQRGELGEGRKGDQTKNRVKRELSRVQHLRGVPEFKQLSKKRTTESSPYQLGKRDNEKK